MPAPFEFDPHRCLERAAQVRPAGAIKNRDQGRIYGVRLAGFHPAPAFRSRLNPSMPYPEAVLEVPRRIVHNILGDEESLGFQITVGLLGAEHRSRAAWQRDGH